MKMTEETTTKKVITLSAQDVDELLPGMNHRREMYRDYRDKIDRSTFVECMPDFEKYKNSNGFYNYENFVADWLINIEDKIIEWNWDYAVEDMERELREELTKALKQKGVEYDRLDFDFYVDEIYELDWNIKEVLGRSNIDWNLCWFNNFDGFMEDENLNDKGALDLFVRLYPNACGDKEKTIDTLLKACNTCYCGSDLKISFRSDMNRFLEMLASGKCKAVGQAVLHLGINGSGSEIFEIDCGEVELDKQVGDSPYDRWTWQLDGHYGVSEVYGGALNEY